jgi:hypothetical protein
MRTPYCACPPHAGKRTEQASRHRKFTLEFCQFPHLTDCALSQENAYLQSTEVTEYDKRTSKSEVGSENIFLAALAKLSEMNVVPGRN